MLEITLVLLPYSVLAYVHIAMISLTLFSYYKLLIVLVSLYWLVEMVIHSSESTELLKSGSILVHLYSGTNLFIARNTCACHIIELHFHRKYQCLLICLRSWYACSRQLKLKKFICHSSWTCKYLLDSSSVYFLYKKHSSWIRVTTLTTFLEILDSWILEKWGNWVS